MDSRVALWSSTELTIDPRQVIQSLPGFLEDQYNVKFVFGTAVTAIEHPVLYTGSGRWQAETVIVCSGDDLRPSTRSTLQPAA
jgi:glycine/D-amino acid oxidase-like deaminating enzyme